MSSERSMLSSTSQLWSWRIVIVIWCNLSKLFCTEIVLSMSGTIIRGTLKAPNSQLVTPISIKLQRPDGCD
jgi:hypothetical protein